MKNWKKFPRVIFYITLLICLLAEISAPMAGVTPVSAAPLMQAATNVVISEFRTRGTNGSSDEFIELYNPTSNSINIGGWQIWGSNNVTPIPGTSSRKIIATGVIIPAGGYYLISYSSGSFTTIADTTYGTGITDDGGIALFSSTDLVNPVDQVGMSINSAYKEGSTLLPLSGVVDQSYQRKFSGCLDDGNNSTDFILTIPSNPQNSASPAAPCTDFSLTMTASTLSPALGSNVDFTITLTNGGPNDATSVTVMDSLPAGLSFAIPAYTASGGTTYDTLSGLWTVGTLVSGTSATLTLHAVVDTGGGPNIAELWNSDQVDPDSVEANGSPAEDDYASVTITPTSLPSLNITNVVNNSNPIVGSNVVFTITVENPLSSPYAATGVTVTAPMLSGLTYVSHSTASGSYVGNIWNIGSLGVNTSATLTVTARVISNMPAAYVADLSSTNFSPASATATITNPLSGEADLILTNDPLTISTSVADRVSLKLRLHNSGPDKATNIQVKDLLPDGLNYDSYTSSQGTYNSSTGIWAISEIASGADVTLTLSVDVAASGTSTQNFAEVWQSDQYDPNSTPGNGEQLEDDEASLEVPVADLSVSETVDVAGSNAVFRITVINAGPDDASGITIKNSKLASTTNYTYISHGNTAGTYNSANGDWTLPTLADGASATLTVTTTTVLSAVNWAQVSATSAVDPDSLPANCSGTAPSCTEDDDAGAPSADLYLSQSVNNTNPNVGANVIFTITAHNAGIAGTTNVQVKSLLPSGLTYVSNDQDTAYSKTSGIWMVGQLDSGTSKTLNITATVATQGIKTNLAEVWKSDQDDPDSRPADGSTSDDDDVSVSLTSYRTIILNEVAWGGTVASADDEWLELYNPGSSTINITGWTLQSTSGSISITLSGSISAGGYFLLERDDNSTVSDVPANQIYSGALSDAGETLTLSDGAGQFIDTANGNGGAWSQGSASSNYGSMERVGITAETDSTWTTNVGTPKNGLNANAGYIYGTPKKVNSTGIPATPTATIPPPTAIPLVGRPIINEFLSRPGFDWNQDGKVDVFDEFIEIKNIGVVDINVGGWKLDDESEQGSSPFVLPSLVLKPGQRVIYYGLQTNILLSDGGDTVRLLNPSNKVYDAYTYAIAKVVDQSVCRLPDGNGSWYEDCLPTPNLLNSREGKVPSMPGGEDFESPVCELPDTLPADFLFAECRGYGADIWHSFFWDESGWQGEQSVFENMSKWESFVE